MEAEPAMEVMSLASTAVPVPVLSVPPCYEGDATSKYIVVSI